AHDFDKRRWFDLTWVRYLRMTLWADPPRANIIVASARAAVFSVTMRNASDWALGPPAKSFIILKCITCCVSIPSIAVSPAIFIQFVNNMYPPLIVCRGKDNLSQRCSFHAATEMRKSSATVRSHGARQLLNAGRLPGCQLCHWQTVAPHGPRSERHFNSLLASNEKLKRSRSAAEYFPQAPIAGFGPATSLLACG
ncbi:MAG: hypothetical protein ACR2GC_02840, partial [Methyloceanibacter sp.]|uniref:hypothetical protein n=1 Tax=Methyloceanibacter sp. TaxID=1965321 RepID=UPI003D9BF876